MEWASVTAREAIGRLKLGACALDVRSPVEFSHGSIPGFINKPILNDSHRHDVGLTYKEKGQDAAIELGMALVLPQREAMVRDWQSTLLKHPPDRRLLTCWRGGLRSKISAQWLREFGVDGERIAGGYKGLRAELLSTFNQLPELLVLGGLTGAGKTDLLRRLDSKHVLDLELYANHRGSSFGLRLDAAQPAQATFENAIGLALFAAPPCMVVEAESRMVGKCVVPAVIKAAMDSSAMVMLECTEDDRVQRLFVEYVQDPVRAHGSAQVHDHLSAALKRTERRLGGLRYQNIQALLNKAFLYQELKCATHAPWIESLLKEYYDPLYAHTIKANAGRVAFRGGLKDVQDYLTDHLSRRRS